MLIKFQGSAEKYRAGDVAGFTGRDEAFARHCVERGVAVEVDEDGNPIEPETEGEDTPDLESMSKDELVTLAEKREVTVTRAEGEGDPLKSDYVRALTEADEGVDADEGEGDEGEGDDDQSDEPSS